MDTYLEEKKMLIENLKIYPRMNITYFKIQSKRKTLRNETCHENFD